MTTGKNILNTTKKSVSIPSNTPSIQIEQTDEKVILSINKMFLMNSSTFDISNSLLTALSPLFLDKMLSKSITPDSQVKSSYKHIAFFIEHVNHYTGGRYSVYMNAVLLSQFTKVTIVTNEIPLYSDDFKEYYNDNFRIVKSINYLSDNENNEFDLIVGCPVKGGQFAFHYAKKFSLPLFLIMFESPNWIQVFRDGGDSSYEFWAGYKKCLFGANKILVPSYESKKYLIEWMENDSETVKINLENDIEVIYPCINQYKADKIKKRRINIKGKNFKYNVVYISRMAPFKTLIPMLKKFQDDKYHFHIIGKIWPNELQFIEKFKNVTIYGKISDVKKFQIIAESDVLVFPSTFEGFGMPPMEALYFGVPVVAYDLPVLREIYKDSVHYVPVGDVHKLIQAVKVKCEESVAMTQNDWVNDVGSFSLIKSASNKLNDVFEIPKITAGMIVFNGVDYIEYSIKSIYNYVNQIIIVDGAVKGYSSEFRSSDGTLELIQKIKAEIDILNKIEVVQSKNRFWNDKIEMQNEIAKRVTGKYYLKLDHDEIWKPEVLVDVINMMETDKRISVVKMPYHHFWLNFETVAKDAGGKWGTRHPRVWRWKKGYLHVKSFNYFQDLTNDYLKVCTPFVREIEYEGDGIYHFGYVRKLKTLQNKIHYYSNRKIETYVIDTVTKWKEGLSTQPTQKVKSWSEKFDGILPKVLKNHPYSKVKDIREIK